MTTQLNITRAIVLGALVLESMACLPLRYVTQASAGQHQLLQRAVPLEQATAASHTTPHVRDLLTRIPAMKSFGEANGLRKTANYEHYSELFRPEVLWVVSASKPLAFTPRTWRFPIVGSFTYLGWFERPEADAFAADLKNEDLDVDVRPSRAYSTLGWFKDPVVSPMITEGPEALGDLAEVILHESLHATFYVAGQSTLNESVADFVGTELALRYLDQALGPDAFERVRYVDAQAEDASRGAAMKAAYTDLEALYASRVSEQEKRERKKKILAQLRFRAQLRRTPNNATLVQFKTYGSGHVEMKALLSQCSGSFVRFLKTMEAARPSFESAAPHADPKMLMGRAITTCAAP
jgi:predicted aminopeptidase